MLLRAILCRCTGLQAQAELQLGRTADAEASQRKALSYVDPDNSNFTDLCAQHLVVEWRKRKGPGELSFHQPGVPLFAMTTSHQKSCTPSGCQPPPCLWQAYLLGFWSLPLPCISLRSGRLLQCSI